MPPVVEIVDLEVRRAKALICRLPRLEVERRERLALLGENGSGKTTLLRLLAGLERSTSGRCVVSVERRRRALVLQRPALFRGTVLTNVTYGLRARGQRRAEAEQLARDWLDRFRIGSLASRNARELSGGEVRRAALCQALILRPALVLLDEPLADLDAEGEEQLRATLDDLDSTVIISSPTPLPDGLTQRTVTL